MSPLLFVFTAAGFRRDAWLIQPGRTAGRLTIGRTADAIMASFGPQLPGREGDAAMGHIWNRWLGRTGHELDVYTTRNLEGNKNFVTQVRVTSPAFHTADGLHVGSSYGEIAKQFPVANSVQSLPGWRLIDDRRDGIAIEVANEKCTAIVVHPRGKGVLETYLPFPGYNAYRS